MKIFISHATKNKEIVLKFAKFLESISSKIEVFCSSESGSISVGKNFIETIFEELNDSDLFAPILSREYYESRFCMIELGVAYSYLLNKYEKNGEEYIFPFVLYPETKGTALSGTPMANIQAGEINDENDIRSFLECLSTRDLQLGPGINRKLHSFKSEIDQIFLRYQDIMDLARIGVFFDDSIDYKKREDIVSYRIKDDSVIANFNMNPYEIENVRYPNFISVVLGYADKLDIGRYLDFNDAAEFRFSLTSFTNSLMKISVEFKYSDSNKVLETFEFPIVYGENRLSVPLKKMRSRALREISELCFVIHPDDVAEEKGIFRISEIRIQ